MTKINLLRLNNGKKISSKGRGKNGISVIIIDKCFLFLDKSKMIFLNFLGGIYCITDENTIKL